MGAATGARREERARQSVIKALNKAGWKSSQLRWSPEWPVPATPHDLTRRERKQPYKCCGRADLVAFADDSGEAHALQIIFELKESTIDKGRAQLLRYLSSEPVVRMGYWTNGTESLAIYKSHTNDWSEVPGAPLPRPDDDLTAPPIRSPTWNDLLSHRRKAVMVNSFFELLKKRSNSRCSSGRA